MVMPTKLTGPAMAASRMQANMDRATAAGRAVPAGLTKAAANMAARPAPGKPGEVQAYKKGGAVKKKYAQGGAVSNGLPSQASATAAGKAASGQGLSQALPSQATRPFKKGGAVKKAKGGMACSPRKKMAMGGMAKKGRKGC